ncbi:hypothetical protein L218DRAFT_612458 [Marasmius fiardii PR-910]|nr:hypothetical protein L218DRAFT_612458 [Marasmius fiardii PR-910]
MNPAHEQNHSNKKSPSYLRDEGSIFSRIRTFNRHAFSSLGSFFSSSGNIDATQQRFENDDEDINNQYVWDPASDLMLFGYEHPQAHHPGSLPNHQPQNVDSLNATNILTPTPSRPVTPQNRLSDVKRIFSFGRNQRSTMSQASLQPTPMLSHSGFCEYYEETVPLESLQKTRPPMISTQSSTTIKTSCSDFSDIDETPPLSPDVADSMNSFPLLREFDGVGSRDSVPVRPSLEIREGKKPERSVCYDTLIDDICSNTSEVSQVDEAEGWYGLEYTLALSVKERRASETYSYDESAGEFSKSRESWAALHQGTIHPFLEDEDYYEWKNWHRRLDREDEKRKYRRGLEFKARSKDMAWLYLAEMKARDVYYWQLEIFGMVGDDVKEHLSTLCQHRKDPYYPPKKHSLGWYLKRSRSVACIRELKPK